MMIRSEIIKTLWRDILIFKVDTKHITWQITFELGTRIENVMDVRDHSGYNNSLINSRLLQHIQVCGREGW